MRDKAMTATAAIAMEDSVPNAILGRPGFPGEGMVVHINRARLREPINLAYETVDWLESKGLKRGEQCAFREVAEKIWFTQK